MNRKIDITGVVLRTDRLTLRPWRESDLNDFYAYASVDGRKNGSSRRSAPRNDRPGRDFIYI